MLKKIVNETKNRKFIPQIGKGESCCVKQMCMKDNSRHKSKKAAFTLAEGATQRICTRTERNEFVQVHNPRHVARQHDCRKVAFTLAEVLITLAVIGVVAALTIPTLIQNYQEKVTVTKVKKMYSTLSNAYELVKTEYGDISQWSSKGVNNSAEDSVTMREKFEKYLKYSNLCDNPEDLKACGVADVIYQNDDKKVDIVSPSVKNKAKQGCGMVLADGSSLYFHSSAPDWKLFYFDVNGLKGPNTFGRDIFPFDIRLGNKSNSPICGDSEDANAVLSNCDTGVSRFCCTAWVVWKSNMDYLK